jgi:hypothetical protein
MGTVNLEVDTGARTAMLDYAIGRAWWGQRIATDATRAVIAWAQRDMTVQSLPTAAPVVLSRELQGHGAMRDDLSKSINTDRCSGS